MISPRKSIILILALCLFGCGEGGESNPGPDAELGDIAAYTHGTLREMTRNGGSEKAIQILRARSETKTATIDDFLLLAEIHIDRLEPAEASSALGRAEMKGATKQTLALHAAEVLMLEGRFSSARDELQLIPMIGSTGFKVAMLRGKIESADSDMDAARRFYAAAGRLKPMSTEPEIELALLEFADGNLDAAFSLAESANANPSVAKDDGRPEYILGAISRLRRENEKAISYLESALNKDPDAILPKLEMLGAQLDAGEREGAQKILDQIIARAPTNPIAKFYVAYLQWQDGEYSAAKDLLLKTDALLSNYRPAKKLYANAAFDEGDYEGAAKSFREYLTEIPGDIEVRLKLANSLQQLGQPNDALRIVTPVLPEGQSVADKPNQASANPEADMVATRVKIIALSQAGSAELAQNNIGSAQQKYAEALKLAQSLDPTEPDVERPIAVALATIEFNTGDQDTGIQLMKEAAKVGDPTPQQLTRLANMQLLAGKLDDAATTLEQIKNIEGVGPIKDNLAGTLAMRHKDYAGAIAAFSKAIEVNPGYLSAIKNRAAAYIENEMFNEALTDLKTLTPHARNDGQYFAMLAKTQQRLGNFVAAINAFEAALEFNPDSSSLNANYAVMLGQKERYKEAVVAAKRALTLLSAQSQAAPQIEALIKNWETTIERQTTLGSRE